MQGLNWASSQIGFFSELWITTASCCELIGFHYISCIYHAEIQYPNRKANVEQISSAFNQGCAVKEAHNQFYDRITNIADCEQIHRIRQQIDSNIELSEMVIE